MGNCKVTPEQEKAVKALGFLRNRGTDNFSGRIITVNGKITADQNIRLSEAANKFGNGIVTMTTRLTLECQGIPFDKIEDFRKYVAEAGLETGGTGSKIRPVVSCKGSTCQYGLIDTFALSEEIHKRFYEGYRQVKLPHKFKVAVGGCPNNCVKPDLNDFGIVGQLKPVYDEDDCNGCRKCSIEKICAVGAAKLEDGVLKIDETICNNCGRCVGKCNFDAIEKGIPGFKVYIGGRWGKKIALGKALSKMFTTKEEVLDVLERAILLFREQGKTGERFSKTIERLGFDYVEKEITEGDILNRKKEILEAELHMTGGATC